MGIKIEKNESRCKVLEAFSPDLLVFRSDTRPTPTANWTSNHFETLPKTEQYWAVTSSLPAWDAMWR